MWLGITEEFHYHALVGRSLQGFLSQSMIPTSQTCVRWRDSLNGKNSATSCRSSSPDSPIHVAETPPSFWGRLNPQNSDRKLSLQRVRQDSLMEHSVPGRQTASHSSCGCVRCTHTPCTAPNRIAEWFLQARHLYLDLCIQSTYQLWKSYFYSCLQIRKLKLDGATTLGPTLPLRDLELNT